VLGDNSVYIRINKKQLANAEHWYARMKGYGESSASAICIAVRKLYTNNYGVDPGFLSWEDLDIVVKEEVPAGV
jgi:hypothetical protein